MSKPRPLAVGQTFDGHFDPNVRFPDLMQAMREFSECLKRQVPSGDEMATSVDKLNEQLESDDSAPLRANTMIVPAPWSPDIFDSLEIEREIWRDRLQVMQRSAPTKDRTIAAQIDMFLDTKEQEAGANGVSVSRLYSLRLHLTGFASWIGVGTAVDKISGTDLINYRLQLLKKVADGEFARTTASDRLSSVKSFVRWLWQSEAIENLPRVLHPRSKLLEIGKSSTDILTYTEAEIAKLLQQASERTRLFILMTLNTAMTQKDISDLMCDEVDWEMGRINRKRSKTRKSANVPTVSYLLWPETRELLTKHRSNDLAGRVFLNSRGEPLLTEQIGEDGKYSKMDNVRSAFDRLRKKSDIDKPFKCLKKTSASRLRESQQFHSVVGLFLGHAPREVSDRFYAAAPQQLLDDAICWLRDHYASHNCFALPVGDPMSNMPGNCRAT